MLCIPHKPPKLSLPAAQVITGGLIELSDVEPALTRLQGCAEPGVLFSEDQLQLRLPKDIYEKAARGEVDLQKSGDLRKPHFRFGVCTALALHVIVVYMGSLAQRMDLTPKERIKLATKVPRGGSLYSHRAQQIAFNTIVRDPEQPVIDFKRAKIQSLLNYHGNLHIDYCSEEIVIDPKSQDLTERMEAIVQQLQPGLYFLRMLLPENNAKEEYHGHSLVYVHGQPGESSFLYDPSRYVKEIRSGKGTRKLLKYLITYQKAYGVTHTRFYHLTGDTIQTYPMPKIPENAILG